MPLTDAAVQHWLAANRAAIAATHDAKARAAAQKALDATIARMRTPARVPSASTDLRAAAAQELAMHGRYDLDVRVARPVEKSLWDRFWDWVGDQWNRFWRATGDRINLGSSAWSAIGWLVLIAILGGLLVIAIRLLSALQIDREKRRGVSSPLDAGRNAHALYLQACASAREGDYAQAARVLFVAAVTALDLRGLMRDDASATVGELRRALRARDGGLIASFDELAGPFVTAAYAEREVVAAEWERALAGYRALVRTESA